MPERRFELLHLSALPPQDSVSTNSTTRAPKITVHPVKTPVPNRENRRTRTFDPLLKRQLLYQLSYILNRTSLKQNRTSLLLVLVSQALLMTIFTTHLFALVHRHFMTFSFLSARHILNDFTLVLKAINIRPPFIKSKPLVEKGRKNIRDQAFIYLKNSLLSFVSTIFSRMNSMHSIGFLSARYFRNSHVLESSS